MASGVEATIVVEPSDAPLFEEMWADTVHLLARLEHRWSRFVDGSDISRLNRAGGRPVVVDPSTVTLLRSMVHGWHCTDGMFDPTVLPALLRAGYNASIDDPTRITILPEPADVSASIIDIDIDGTTVRLPAGLAIDPGGIGKGLAADLAVDRLMHVGAVGALVSIGGDMTMRGTPPDHVRGPGWTVAVERPDVPGDSICTIALDAGGVATSSTRSRRWRQGDRDHHHAIDPRHLAPSRTDLATVTVIDRSGWLAEVHSTAALLEASAGVIDYLDRHDLTGIAVTSAGHVLSTADLDPCDAASSLMPAGGWFG